MSAKVPRRKHLFNLTSAGDGGLRWWRPAAGLPRQQWPSIPETLLRLMDVVRPASELDVVDDGWPAESVRPYVVELQKPSLAATALGADERALTAIPLPDYPPHRGGNVTGGRRWPTRRAGAVGRGELGALEIGEQQYLIAAVDYVQDGQWYDPEFLADLRPRAQPLSLAEAESKRIDLTVQK